LNDRINRSQRCRSANYLAIFDKSQEDAWPTVSTLTSDDKPRNNKLHPLFGGHNRERAPVPISARYLTIMRMLGFAVTSGGEKSIHPAAAAARATAATAAVAATLRYPIVAVNCYNGHARGRTIKAGR